jgi:hypothetical protein
MKCVFRFAGPYISMIWGKLAGFKVFSDSPSLKYRGLLEDPVPQPQAVMVAPDLPTGPCSRQNIKEGALEKSGPEQTVRHNIQEQPAVRRIN